MKKIANKLVEEIIQKSDIVEVVSNYIPLQSKGKDYVGVCPFHDDHDPSMRVNPAKQIFKCFVCGAGGNAIGFIQKYEKISFPKAVVKAGKICGIEVDFEETKIEIPQNLLTQYELMQQANNYLVFQLHNHQKIKDYLEKRELDKNSIERFQLGYDDGLLTQFLIKKGYSIEAITKVNLAYSNVYGNHDVFENRLTIPIHNHNGNLVGYSARIIEDSDKAKYINSMDSEIYHKGDILFNYHRILDLPQTRKNIYVVEGVMDVIAFDKADVRNVVCSLGTAITTKQLQLLKKLNTTVVVCYDGDKAGQNAIYKFGKQAVELNIKFEIVRQKNNLDPDDILKKYGKEVFLETIENTYSWVSFLFDYLSNHYNLNNYSEKKKFVDELRKEIAKVNDIDEQNTYKQKLKEISGYSFTTVSKKEKPKVNLKLNMIQKTQMQIIAQLLCAKDSINVLKFKYVSFSEDVFKDLFLKIQKYYYQYPQENKVDIEKLLENIEDVKQQLLIKNIVEDSFYLNVYNQSLLTNLCDLLNRYYIDEEVKRLKKYALSLDNEEERLEVGKKILQLIMQSNNVGR